MIFIDSNIPMYLVGADHSNKITSIKTAEELLTSGEKFVTSAEVFQELLHRYFALSQLDYADSAFEVLRELVEEIFPILPEDVFHASRIVREIPKLSSRDALHLATMKRHGVKKIFTFDKGFDRVPGIEKIPHR